MFLRHLVPWPSIDIQVKFTDIVPGEPVRQRGEGERVKRKRGSQILYSDFGPVKGYISETVQDRR